jgi:hypothetical protein
MTVPLVTVLRVTAREVHRAVATVAALAPTLAQVIIMTQRSSRGFKEVSGLKRLDKQPLSTKL